MNTPGAAARDPSRVSWYVDDALYDRLLELSADWQRTTPVAAHERPEARAAADAGALIAAEARLADALALEQWLDCYAPECIYWVPSRCPAGDPRREVTLEIHDRRRLEDRVARIRTGFAYSMIPPIRTTHVLGVPELWRGAGEDELRGRAAFLIDALFRGHHRVLSGWAGFCLLRAGGRWRIGVKQVNLIDADRPQENNTFFL